MVLPGMESEIYPWGRCKQNGDILENSNSFMLLGAICWIVTTMIMQFLLLIASKLLIGNIYASYDSGKGVPALAFSFKARCDLLVNAIKQDDVT